MCSRGLIRPVTAFDTAVTSDIITFLRAVEEQARNRQLYGQYSDGQHYEWQPAGAGVLSGVDSSETSVGQAAVRRMRATRINGCHPCRVRARGQAARRR